MEHSTAILLGDVQQLYTVALMQLLLLRTLQVQNMKHLHKDVPLLTLVAPENSAASVITRYKDTFHALIVRLSQALRKHLKEASTLPDVFKSLTFIVSDKYFIKHEKQHRTANNSTLQCLTDTQTQEYKMHKLLKVCVSFSLASLRKQSHVKSEVGKPNI